MVSREEFDELKKMVETLNDEIKHMKIKESKEHEENNNLSIIFLRYKKSILVKNMFDNKNTTKKCKKVFISLGGKWFNKKDYEGWLFLGLFNSEDESLEESCKFIITELENNNFNLEYKFN